MGMVTFINPKMHKPLSVDVRPFERRTLLSLLTQLKLFDESTCKQGRCGQCAVKVASVPDRQASPTVRLNENERTILYRCGKLTRDQYNAEEIPVSPPLWRLACQYVVSKEEIFVAI